MIDERKMLSKLVEYQKELIDNGNLDECATVCDLIKWIVEQPKVDIEQR